MNKLEKNDLENVVYKCDISGRCVTYELNFQLRLSQRYILYIACARYMRPENKSYIGLFLLSISALFLIPVSVPLVQDLPESSVSARIPNHAPFFAQSDFAIPHRPPNPPHRGDSFIPHPPQVPFDVAGYPVAPPIRQLEQVHVYVRHGKYQFPAATATHLC